MQSESLIKNLKRLHSRDGALSETIDTGMVQAAKSSITPGTSRPGTASSTQNYQQRAEAPPTAILEGTASRSDLGGDEPADAVNTCSKDQNNDGAGLDEETSTVLEEEILSISRAKSSPFYELAQYIFHKSILHPSAAPASVHQTNALYIIQVQDRPSMLPTVPSGLSAIHDEMFRLALKLLKEPGNVIHKKDAL
ncbi:hypothetical protein BG003_011303 [Podila horticola]|nr:hypothetical protein BG003_011303 [Podila horticola]